MSQISEIESAAISAYGAGFSQRAVGAMLGISRRQVAYILKRFHFPSMHNPETVVDREQRRYFDMMAARDATTAAFDDILRRDPCGFCGQTPVQVDHIYPRKLGGADVWDNLSALCGRCNMAKGKKPLLLALLDTTAML